MYGNSSAPLTGITKQASAGEIHDRNVAFYRLLRGEGGDMSKEAMPAINEFLRAQIYEDSVQDLILPTKPITVDQMDRSAEHPDLYRVEDKEFRSSPAVVMDMRGAPTYRYVEGDRYRIDLQQISTPIYEIKEKELRSMRQPLETILRTQIAFELRKRKDLIFKGMLAQALNFDTGRILDLRATGATSITPEIIARGRNLLDRYGDRDGRYVETTRILMHKSQYNNISAWPQLSGIGGPNTGPGVIMGCDGTSYMEEGFKGKQLQGLTTYTTVKGDVFNPNIVWFFTEPDLMGKSYSLGDEALRVQKEWDSVRLMGSFTYAAALGNMYCVAAVLLADQPSA